MAKVSIKTHDDIRSLEDGPLEKQIQIWTVYDLVRNGANLSPDNPALQFLPTGRPDEQPETTSYRDFLRRVHQVANLLHSLGIAADDAVTLMLPLVPQNYISLIAATAAGIANPVNWMLEPSHLVEILRATKAKVLVAYGPSDDFDIWDKVEVMRDQLPDVQHIIQVRPPGSPTKDKMDFDTLADDQPDDRLISGRVCTADDIAIYAHTGGTTGSPKIAQLQHRGLAYKCWAYEILLEQQAGQSVFAVHPLFHIGGIVYHTISAFARGITSVIPGMVGFRNRQVIADYWKLVEKFRITDFFGVPTTLSALANIPVGDSDISSLRPYCMTGSAGLSADLASKFEHDIGVRVLCNYGMTENTATIALPPRDGDPRYGSAGFPLPYTNIRTVITNADGGYERECETDEIGLILIQGPGVIPGYLDPALNSGLFFEPGWLNTGDLGRIDADGYLWITGRIKDVINRSGHNIDPVIIEEALLGHDTVQLAAAVGKPDAYAGELPVAFVQLKPGQEVTPEELLDFAETHVPERAAIPKNITILETMPLTGVGKIFKPKLREIAAQSAFEEMLRPLLGAVARIDVSLEADRVVGQQTVIRISNATGNEHAATEALTSLANRPKLVWEG